MHAGGMDGSGKGQCIIIHYRIINLDTARWRAIDCIFYLGKKNLVNDTHSVPILETYRNRVTNFTSYY